MRIFTDQLFARLSRSHYQCIIFILLTLGLPGFTRAQIQNALAPDEEPPGKTIEVNPTPITSFSLGGALWLRGASQRFQQSARANRRGLYVDQFRLAISGEHGEEGKPKLKFGTQVRWWTYQFAVVRMWFGVEFQDYHEVRLGVTEVPFGAMPSISSSFWFSLNYYHGLEGEQDAGLHYKYQKDGFRFDLAYFANDEYNAPGALNRFAPDLHTFEEQQNFERNQGNIRLAYTFGHGTSTTHEIGVSGQYGLMPNQTTDQTGDRWASAFHYIGNYGSWNLNLQAARYEYNPVNPAGVDDRTVLMGFFSDRRLVAARANTFTGSIRRFWKVDWGLFTNFNAYVEYSTVHKDVSSFNNSEIIDVGSVANAGPFYVWIDILWGRNAWWFNDSETNSGPGEGAINPNKWEIRSNVSIQWFF